MAHAASQLKKNRGEVDVNALEDEKEKRRKSRRTSSREQKRKVTAEGRLAAGGFICPAVLASLEHDSVCVCVCTCVSLHPNLFEEQNSSFAYV